MIKLIVLIALLQQEQDPVPDRESRPAKPDRSRVALFFDGGTDILYNDNITRLDDADHDRLEDGDSSEKFRIEQPDDLILAPRVGVGIDFSTPQGKIRARLEARLYRYQTNDVANYEEIEAEFRHRNVVLEYTLTPRRYRREYRDPATGRFDSGIYREHELELEVRPRIHPDFDIRPLLEARIRDFEDPFDFRDALRYGPGVSFPWDVAEWFEFETTYLFLVQRADAHRGLPDTSYREHRVEFKMTFRPAKGVEFGAGIRRSFRDYTTDNDPAADPGHAGRSDDGFEATVFVQAELWKDVFLSASYEYRKEDADAPHDTGATAEETSWLHNIYTLGIGIQF